MKNGAGGTHTLVPELLAYFEVPVFFSRAEPREFRQVGRRDEANTPTDFSFRIPNQQEKGLPL
jgi:hypothetical protein